jgi:hypothetical protein
MNVGAVHILFVSDLCTVCTELCSAKIGGSTSKHHSRYRSPLVKRQVNVAVVCYHFGMSFSSPTA